MVKKTSQTSQPDVALPPSLWVDPDVLDKGDSKASIMKETKLITVKPLLGRNVVAVLPRSDERADWYRKGWVCFYYYPFDIGLVFPFSKFIRDTFTYMRISPGQLMSFAWRTLACLDAIEAKHQLGIDVNVVKCCYNIKKFYKARFSFTHKKPNDPLILNVGAVNDRNWKDDFFFSEKSSLGEEASHFLDLWTSTGNGYMH